MANVSTFNVTTGIYPNESDTLINHGAIVLNSIRILSGLAAITGNFLIVQCIVKYKILQTTTNIVIANLASADFLNGIQMMFASRLKISSCWYYNTSTWLLLKQVGQTLKVLGFLANSSSIFYITFERFVAIKMALHYYNTVTVRLVMTIIVITWICNGSLSILPRIVPNLQVKIIIYPTVITFMIGTMFLSGCITCIAYKKIKKIIP